MLCENDEQVERCYESLYTRMFVLNLTPTGAHWRQWGGEHPLGDDWALSGSHRSTRFTRAELLDICAKVRPADIDHMLYLGTPEDVAARAVKWYRAMGLTQLPQILHWDAATFACPELAEPAPSGVPRWHELHLRYLAHLNKMLVS